jgi:tetratricopeptide (TPR) repeat protein
MFLTAFIAITTIANCQTKDTIGCYVYDNKDSIIYDMCADTHYTYKTIKNYIDSADKEYNNKNYYKGIWYCNKVIKFNYILPSDKKWVAFHTRANCRINVDDYKNALKDISTLIKLGHSDYDWRADIKSITGDIDGAIKDYNKAIERNPSHEHVYLKLAILERKHVSIVNACIHYKIAKFFGAEKHDELEIHCKFLKHCPQFN